ncbi:MAG: DUF1697 domain-containing protein [Acidobacteriota bacterium]|nr:DUF1697 domain-containing protein [Acidobacteriota bacterium]
MIPYVAILRGINVGGHAVIKMPVLKAAFEKMGCEDVRTVLASGNMVFAAWQARRCSLSSIWGKEWGHLKQWPFSRKNSVPS